MFGYFSDIDMFVGDFDDGVFVFGEDWKFFGVDGYLVVSGKGMVLGIVCGCYGVEVVVVDFEVVVGD